MLSTKVISSNIDQVWWDQNTLHILFLNGRAYRYDGVPEEVYQRLVKAESVGKEFNANIKNVYNCTPVVSHVPEVLTA